MERNCEFCDSVIKIEGTNEEAWRVAYISHKLLRHPSKIKLEEKKPNV